MRKGMHIAVIAVALFCLLGVPFLVYADRLTAMYGSRDVDAVSSASLELPDQPSGEYVILVNREKHKNSLEEWKNFFLEQPVDVIFEDIECIVADGDVNGRQLADRFRARLAENQMTVKSEQSLLAASRAQWGNYDVMIFSREMADACQLETVYDHAETELIWIRSSGT